MADPTFLNLVNAVQRRLRADVTASVTTTNYSTMIGDLVNQALSEVAHAHTPWIGQWSTISSASLSGDDDPSTEHLVSSASLNDSPAFSVGMVWTTTSTDTTPRYASLVSHDRFQKVLLDQPTQVGVPTIAHFSSRTSGAIDMRLHPAYATGTTFQIHLTLWLNHTKLSADGSQILGTMELPVVLKAFELALAERGEEDTSSLVRHTRDAYRSALADAIGADRLNAPPMDWHVV